MSVSHVARKDLLTLSTELSESSPYYYGMDITERFADVLKQYPFDKIFFVTAEPLFRLYGEEFVRIFNQERIPYDVLAIGDREEDKCFRSLEELCDSLVERGVTKGSIIVSFGGGCLGNIVGLAASLIYRGVRYVEIPTTLMGITDSTLSNKQAVNGKFGKNHFGTYYRPLFIWSDIKYLQTEKLINTKAAIVEGIKNGFISDGSLLDYLDSELQSEREAFTLDELYDLALNIIQSKLNILRRDPTEKSYAMILEYGHTFGHAIEWLTKGAVIHGLAVAKGMCIAAELSRHLGMLPEEGVEKHYHLLGRRLGLDLSIPKGITPRDILNVIHSDNKKGASGIKYILLEEIGACSNPDGDYQVFVDPETVEQVLGEYMTKNGGIRNEALL
ncbi:hypothetical protein ACFSL6_09355 [Paenibacillus thailandensis]|uniref:3-dehydroquinate synthase n=1 Tax=Paenibacillus thailandensis TaxID=393250 RepID=A0ABW5R3V1_9BACL